MTAWDARQVAGSSLFAALAFLLAWLVTAATDEGSVAWSVRAARTLPLAPACAALGTWLGQARAWARGEGRALAALGRSPLASSAPAVLGGAAIAWIAAVAMGFSGSVDIDGFYPLARSPDVYVAAGDGAFIDLVSGYRIEKDGAIVAPAATGNAPRGVPPSRLPERARAAAASSTGLAGLALPLLVARGRRGSRVGTVLVLLLMAVASIFLFHAAAVRRVSAMSTVLPPLAVLSFALVRLCETRPRFMRGGSLAR